MIPAKFDYTRPASLGGGGVRARLGGEDAKVIAGGQSLLPLLRLRFAYPTVLVDVGGLDELRGVRDLGDSLEIGAMTTHYELTRDPLIAAHCGLLAQAAGTIADPAVRHRGHDRRRAVARRPGRRPARRGHRARRDAWSSPGRRARGRSAPADFFTDYLTTSLAPGEILTAVRVPKLGDGWGYRYEKFHLTAQAWAIVGVAAVATALQRARRGGQGRAHQHGLGARSAAHAVEAAAAGAEASAAALAAAAQHADEGTSPPSDLRGAADYRRHLARVLTGRALAAAAGL